ncbi:hypothetical protein [Moraxella bovis]|uniref:hypothetical protein n=1 Tax=Moraxella bovis TaxID=476 RepID=UPI0015F14291|nr:hypothetical protein [Moraxella bovis]UYZ69981.1 hypothetical protein LP089_07460 [Moraxella bovis]UZA04907.1 hypothetical protein LP099_06875 [Moraxella bovis]UZA12855.1 hypothetical protein LP123_07410 [Moraxella bovis]UZA28390.1 hypothetical protein LP119_05395 [Moraxella bovis]
MIEQYGLAIFVVFVLLPLFLSFCICSMLLFDMIKERRKFKKEFEQAKKRWRD